MYERSLGLGQYQPGVVYAVKRGQAQGIPTHEVTQRAPGATHSTREHKHAGQRGLGTRIQGPTSLRAM